MLPKLKQASKGNFHKNFLQKPWGQVAARTVDIWDIAGYFYNFETEGEAKFKTIYFLKDEQDGAEDPVEAGDARGVVVAGLAAGRALEALERVLQVVLAVLALWK